jgi:hypothetical protein
MSARNFSWFRLFGGAAAGGVVGEIMLLVCTNISAMLLGGDEAAGTAGEIMIFLGAPVALVVGAVLGGRILGYMDLRLLAAVGGAMLGVVMIYLLAIPVYIVYGGALDPTGVGCTLFYGGPFAVFFGARWGRREFDRVRRSTRLGYSGGGKQLLASLSDAIPEASRSTE